HPGWHIISIPVLTVVAATLAFASETRREALLKTLAAGCAVAAHVFLGTYQSLYYLYADTARTLLAPRFVEYPHVPYVAGHLFRGAAVEVTVGLVFLWGLI